VKEDLLAVLACLASGVILVLQDWMDHLDHPEKKGPLARRVPLDWLDYLDPAVFQENQGPKADEATLVCQGLRDPKANRAKEDLRGLVDLRDLQVKLEIMGTRARPDPQENPEHTA